MEDDKIIALYWARKEEAISETDRKYGSYCRSISFRILNDKEDSEECVNDTWLHTWNAIPPGKPEFLAGFLGKIVRNLSISKYRAGHAQKRGSGETQALLDELEECIPSGKSVEDEIEGRETAAAINRFLETLDAENASGKGGDCTVKKNEKLFDAIGQIDERYIAEALEPMCQESAGTSDENKAAMPKKGKLFFYRQRRTVAAAAALVICIGAAGIAQWRLHSEEPGPEMAAYDMTGLSAEDGIALQAEDAAAVTPDAGENQGAVADQNAVQGRMANNAETCLAEIYLEDAKVNSEKIKRRLGNRLYAGTFLRKRLGNC